MGSGPRNYDEKRLLKPPMPGKAVPHVRSFRLLELLEPNPRGYEEILVSPMDTDLAQMVDPKDVPVFWVSQNGRHSCVYYDHRMYALMGVRSRTRSVNKVKTTVGKILSLKPIGLPEDSEKLVLDAISGFIFDGD